MTMWGGSKRQKEADKADGYLWSIPADRPGRNKLREVIRWDGEQLARKAERFMTLGSEYAKRRTFARNMEKPPHKPPPSLATVQSPHRDDAHFRGLKADMSVASYVKTFECNAGHKQETKMDQKDRPKPRPTNTVPGVTYKHTALGRACPSCQAKIGQWCKRPSGHRAMDLHAARSFSPARESDRALREAIRPTIPRPPTERAFLGALRVSGEGYIYMRVSMEPGRRGFRPLHHILWEDAHGKIPKGAHLRFKNGEPLDCHVGNLELVGRV